jgi:hypothetical protein
VSSHEPEHTPEPEAPEQGTPSTAAQPPPSLEERLLAGKYKTAEELEKAYQEMQTLSGRQSEELGQLRQFRDYIQQQQTQQTPEQIYDYGEEDPAQATTIALQQYGAESPVYERALRQWAEIDPFSASRFATEVRIQAWNQQVQPQLQQYGLQSAMSELQSKYPDLSEYGEAMLREAENSPVVQALRDSNQGISAGVLETLYLAARGRQGLAQTQQQAADEQTARNVKRQGGTASATAAQPGEPPPATPDDRFHEEYLAAAQRLGLMSPEDS